jgi:hypothetical protein
VEIDEWIRGLDAKPARVKYGSSKALRLASEQTPELVYPHFARFVCLLVGGNTILRWNAAWTLGHLAAADRDGRIEKILRRFCAPIEGPELIGAANAIGAAARIALAKPRLAGRLAREILKVEQASYATPECRNVAIGHAIRSLDCFLGLVRRKRPVIEFVERQLKNPRPATRRKAERFLKKWASNC